MLDGPFNDVATWHYSRIPEVIGTGMGVLIRTEKEFGRALVQARDYSGPALLEVILDPGDISRELRRLTLNLGKKVR